MRQPLQSSQKQTNKTKTQFLLCGEEEHTQNSILCTFLKFLYVFVVIMDHVVQWGESEDYETAATSHKE